MRVKNVPLGPFLGVVTTRDKDAPSPYASSMLNVRTDDGKIRPRYGFVAGTNRLGTDAVYGFAWLTGYDDDYQPKREWVAIEEREGRVAPFSIHPTTGVRTEIGSNLSLAASAWRAISYGGLSYWINGDSPVSVYKHQVADANSWEALGTIESAAPPSDFDVETVTPPYEEFQKLDPADIVTVGAGTGDVNMTNTAGTEDNLAFLRSNDYPTGGYRNAWMEFEIEFDAAKDWSGGVALYYQLTQGGDPGLQANDGFGSKAADNIVSIENSVGASAAALPAVLAGTLNQKAGELHAWVDLSGVGDAIKGDVKKLTIRFEAYKTGRSVYRLSALKLGGMHYTPSVGTLQEAASGTTYDIEYAARYVEGATTSDASTATIAASSHLGERPHPDLPYLGSSIQITVPAAPDPFTAAAEVEIFRKVEGTWRLLHTVAADEEVVFADTLTDGAIDADPVTYPETELTITFPEFVARGVLEAFPMLSWVCWLYPGGRQNVRHSRVGDPERQAARGDEIDDLTRGATFSLSDDLSDEPVTGLAVGNACLIFGTQGVHAQVGNSPSELTPPRKIVGAPPIANEFAACALSIDGVPGAAYVDASAEAVWWIGSSQVFATDAAARPVELTLNQRGLLREHLLVDGVTVDDVRLATDPHTGALWVVAGARAMKFTPPNPIDGQRQWEPYAYAIPIPAHLEVVETCVAQTADVVASEPRSGSTVEWFDPDFAETEDGQCATADLDVGDKTEALVATGFGSEDIPDGASLTQVKLRVRARVTGTGVPVDVVDDLAQLTVSGSPVGANAATLAPLTDEFEWREYIFDPSALGIGLPDLSAGDVGAIVGYKTYPDTPTVFDGWMVSYAADGDTESDGILTPWTPTGNSFSLAGDSDVRSAQIGTIETRAVKLGATVSYIVLQIESEASGNADPGYGGVVTLNDGQGGTAYGSGPQSVSSTKSYRVPVVGGGAAKTVALSAEAAHGDNPFGLKTSAAVSVTGMAVDPDPATVEVDVIELVVCYGTSTYIPAQPSGGEWRFVAFTPERRLAALAERGRVDEMEWNAAAAAFVGGLNRDGGSAMPAAHWESGVRRGQQRRLTHVSVDGEGNPSVTAFADKTPVEGVSRTMTDRTQRFPMECRGWSHRTRISVGEAVTGIDAVILREHTLGERLDS